MGGADLPRAAVNSASGVKSPIGGIFTSITVVLGIFLSSSTTFLRWIPMPVIAAVSLVATIDQMPPISFMLKFWKISFTDFLAFFMTFNVAMVAGNEMGLLLGLGIMIAYTIGRLMFSRPAVVLNKDLEDKYSGVTPPWWARDDRKPPGTQVISLETDVIFLNAERVKRQVVDTAMTYQFGIPLSNWYNIQRAWNYRRDEHIRRLRKLAGVSNTDIFIPRLRVLVLDLSATSFVDASGMQAFEEIKEEVRAYAGSYVEIRLVGLNKGVQTRFVRAGWKLVSPYEDHEEVFVDGRRETQDLIFAHLTHAIMYQSQQMTSLNFDFDEDLDMKLH